MIQPDFKTFSKLARDGNLVPVYENYTADLLTPVGAHLRLAHGAKYSFLLESVEGGENIARYTFTGANPEEVFRSRGRESTITDRRGKVRTLGTTSAVRSSLVPQIPTLVEQGYPDAVAENWTALFAPARTPPRVVARRRMRRTE